MSSGHTQIPFFLSDLGRHDEAIAHASTAVAMRERIFCSPNGVVGSLGNLALILDAAGRNREERDARARILELLEAEPESSSTEINEARNRLATPELELGNLRRAYELGREAFAACGRDATCELHAFANGSFGAMRAGILLREPLAIERALHELDAIDERMRSRKPECTATTRYLRATHLAELRIGLGEVREGCDELRLAVSGRSPEALQCLDDPDPLPADVLAECEVLGGNAIAAIEPLRRKLARLGAADISLDRARTRFLLARALAQLDRDSPETVELARAALAELELMGPDVESDRSDIREFIAGLP